MTRRTIARVVAANLVPMVASAIALERRRLRGRWFRVDDREEWMLDHLGIATYDRALTLIGWNRLVEARRGYDGTIAGLVDLDQHTRRSELGHAVCVVALVVAGAVGLLRRRGLFAAGALGSMVLFHLYPLLLQRRTRLRIRRLQETAQRVRERAAGEPGILDEDFRTPTGRAATGSEPSHRSP